MPVYDRSEANELRNLAEGLIARHYPDFKERGLRIDYLFAHAKTDPETGEATDNAITVHGMPADGVCRKIGLKDRVKGHGDAEIVINGDWWRDASEAERIALLDHELYHIIVLPKNDDAGRPQVRLRKHDFQFGWFKTIAERHGVASAERRQASTLMEVAGQYFWPAMVNSDRGTRASKLEVHTK